MCGELKLWAFVVSKRLENFVFTFQLHPSTTRPRVCEETVAAVATVCFLLTRRRPVKQLLLQCVYRFFKLCEVIVFMFNTVAGAARRHLTNVKRYLKYYRNREGKSTNAQQQRNTKHTTRREIVTSRARDKN